MIDLPFTFRRLGDVAPPLDPRERAAMAARPTVARLRHALEEHFPQARGVIRALRDAGMLPQGRPGRDGVGSAPIYPETAVLVILGCAAYCAPVDALGAAQELAGYPLTATFAPVGPSHRQPVAANITTTFAEWAALELSHTVFQPSYRLRGWQIEPGRCISTFDPGALEMTLGYGPRLLREVKRAKPDLMFEPLAPPGGAAVRRCCLVTPAVLHAVAEVLAQPRDQTLLTGAR